VAEDMSGPLARIRLPWPHSGHHMIWKIWKEPDMGREASIPGWRVDLVRPAEHIPPRCSARCTVPIAVLGAPQQPCSKAGARAGRSDGGTAV
jgi:hypothetical protein